MLIAWVPCVGGAGVVCVGGDVEDPAEESALLAVHVIGKDHELSDVAEDKLGTGVVEIGRLEGGGARGCNGARAGLPLEHRRGPPFDASCGAQEKRGTSRSRRFRSRTRAGC